MSNYRNVFYPQRGGKYVELLCSYLMRKYDIKGPLVDIGCGAGEHVEAFKKNDLMCYGVDKLKDYNDVILCDAEKDELPFGDGEIGCVFCKSVIEHMGNPENLMREIHRILRTGGILILLTPEWKTQWKHFWDDYTHMHPYTIKGIARMLSVFNFNAKSERFYQLPFIWDKPLKIIPIMLSALPPINKTIRFSKETMILAMGYKK